MPLQKSFSDQIHTNKKTGSNWQRNKSFQGSRSRNDVQCARQRPEKPPVPVSSATRNKLNAFQFGDGSTGSCGDIRTLKHAAAREEKENMPTAVNDAQKAESCPSTAKANEGVASMNPEMGASQQGGNEPDKPVQKVLGTASRSLPKTPAGKLALSDLIGMVEVPDQNLNVSPDDRLMWKHDSNAVQHLASSYRALHRGKKRARSSAPVSSSPSHVSEAFDLHRLNQSLKTPQHVQGRAPSSAEKNTTPQLPRLPALAHIMYTSSPQSSRQNSLKKPISRSFSCGTDWPKRRKVVEHEGTIQDDIFVETCNAEQKKLSLVSALLGKVKEGLPTAGPGQRWSHNTCSSPDEGILLCIKEEESSPLRHLNEASEFRENAAVAVGSQREEATELSAHHEVHIESSSSDYGAFDDDMFVEDVDVQITPQPAASTTSAPLFEPEIVAPPVSPRPELARDALLLDEQPERDNNLDVDDDEFGMDDEAFAADLEDIVAKYDTASSTEVYTTVPTATTNMSIVDPTKIATGDVSIEGGSDDEFGNDFSDVDLEAVEAAATQSLQHIDTCSSSFTQKVRAIQRYLITNVVDCQYETANGRSRPEKVLLVQAEGKKEVKSVHLRDGWLETPATVKAYVHIIGAFENGRCVVDDTQNMVILHPDHLLSSTVVADSFSCTRRAVLQERIKATSAAGPPLVYGTMLHEIFQAAMMANRWDGEWLNNQIETITARHVEDLYQIQLQLPHAIEHLKSKMGELQVWAEVFVSAKPKPEATVKSTNGETATMCINKLLDVEEHVWSPMYGLKGNIDATVQVTMTDSTGSRNLTVPFEVKTGKNPSPAHRAQTALYNLLLSDRYDVDIAYGILYYMETSETIRIPGIRHEVRHMIMQRNELACFVRERIAQLPPMMKKDHLCKKCYAQVPCFIYHRLADDGNGETSGMKAKFDEVVKHLTPKHKDFFLKWDQLLTMEERESLKFRRELWTMLSSEREKVGRCFSNVIIQPGSAYEDVSNPKINRFQYVLVKEDPAANFSFLDSQITVGEPIVISDERGNFALANGYVTQVRKRKITVAVDRRLHNARTKGPDFDEVNNQSFAGIMEVVDEKTGSSQIKAAPTEPPVKYRLDKDEFSNGMALVRNNLIQVMAEGPFGSREIRNLVVDLVAPRFKPHSTAYTLTDRENINIDQRRAIEKVMSAQDYALVLGMPGTGKTTTIAHIIRALVSQGKSVLLTSYTHTAVDNILLKLHRDNIPILRLGAAAKVHPEVQSFATLAVEPKKTFEEVRSAWHDSPVVATTCLGINHPIFNERTFDYCIVDEASQITLPTCIGPIRMARTFVLVGDHNQLPPLVQNEEARTGGLDISLFKYLSDAHPSAVVNLEHQYRMCEDVMSLSNSLIYNGRLKCGTKEVAARSTSVPHLAELKHRHYSPSTLPSHGNICAGPVRGQCWLRDLLEPSTKVAFVNTDSLLPLSREEAKGNRIVNKTEVLICSQLLNSLIGVGVPASSIGVMTHYRSQLSLLKDALRDHHDLEMHTADRFQGRDKEVVVLSLVRSNEAGSIGDLLKDWRRINVAFTRAKTKLLVIGSRETLKGGGDEEMMTKFVRLMEQKNWVYELPKGALDMHVFNDFVTQATPSGRSVTSPTKIMKGVGKQRSPLADKRNERFPICEDGKENRRPGTQPKHARIGERALLANKPVLRDIMNSMIG